jgi:hypothetical protein
MLVFAMFARNCNWHASAISAFLSFFFRPSAVAIELANWGVRRAERDKH